MVGLISFFQQFFRHQPDGAISMATFDQTHLILLALTTLGCVFIISDYYLIFKQEKFKKNPGLHTTCTAGNHVRLAFFSWSTF